MMHIAMSGQEPPVDLDALIRRIRAAFTSGQLPDAVAMLDDADQLQLDDDELLVFARVRAVTLSRAGHHAEALKAIDGVAEQWLERGQVAAAVSVSSMEAYIHNSLGQLDAALDAAAWTLALLGEIDDGAPVAPVSRRASGGVGGAIPSSDPRLLVAATRNTMGLLFLDLEAVDLAITEFSRVIDHADDDPVMMSIARGNLAGAFLRKAMRHRGDDDGEPGPHEDLLAAERLARGLLASDAPPRRLVEAAAILAAVLHNTDRHDEAADVLARYEEYEHLVDDARAMVDWNLLWARTHRLAGRYDEARARVERAVHQAERNRDRIAVTLARRERSRISEAVGDLRAALDDLRTADDDARQLRSGRFEALVEQLIRRAGLEASRRRLEREAAVLGAERTRLMLATETDPLTGVGNRRRLAAALAAVSSGPAGLVSVLMLDVDRFKSVNDDRGHAHGDAVLLGLAETLTGVARELDVICRPGGDEFVLVLPGVAATDARSVAERIRRKVSELLLVPADGRVVAGAGMTGGLALGVTVSIGVASGTSDEVADLIDLADDALLSAKRGGRDQIRVASRTGEAILEAG